MTKWNDRIVELACRHILQKRADNLRWVNMTAGQKARANEQARHLEDMLSSAVDAHLAEKEGS